jgi:hypothetical protein
MHARPIGEVVRPHQLQRAKLQFWCSSDHDGHLGRPLNETFGFDPHPASQEPANVCIFEQTGPVRSGKIRIAPLALLLVALFGRGSS